MVPEPLGIALFCNSEVNTAGGGPEVAINPSLELASFRLSFGLAQWTYRYRKIPDSFSETKNRSSRGVLFKSTRISTSWTRHSRLLPQFPTEPMDIVENVHFCSGEFLGKPVSPVWGFLLYFHCTTSVRRNPKGCPGVWGQG